MTNTGKHLPISDMNMLDRNHLKKIAESKRKKLEEALNHIIDVENEEILNLAIELFNGNLDAAIDWLLSPIKLLGGDAPADRLHSDKGREEIKIIIGRIEHGVFS